MTGFWVEIFGNYSLSENLNSRKKKVEYFWITTMIFRTSEKFTALENNLEEKKEIEWKGKFTFHDEF